MIEINKNINLNKELVLWLTIRNSKTGEIIYSEKANSFLGSFVILLGSMMGGFPPVTREGAPIFGPQSGSYNINQTLNQIDDVDIISSPDRYRVTETTHGLSTGAIVQLMGVNDGFTASGDHPANGLHSIVVLDSDHYTVGEVVGGAVNHDNGLSQAFRRRLRNHGGNSISNDVFRNPDLRIGTNQDSNTINLSTLVNEIPASFTVDRSVQTSGGQSVEEPAIGATDSEIEIRRNFVNNCGITIPISEIGLYTYVGNQSGIDLHTLLARDVLSTPVDMDDGDEYEFVYNLTISAPSSGGVLIQFNELLYRHIAQTNRESKDIFNQNQVSPDQNRTFYLAFPGGSNRISFTIENTQAGQFLGPQLGTSSDNIVNTHFRLQLSDSTDTKIYHGIGTGELYHYGTYVTNVTISVNTASFEVIRFFENLSGGLITANETGLYVGAGTSTQLEDVHCIARNLIGGGLSINNGDIVKLTYTIGITV